MVCSMAFSGPLWYVLSVKVADSFAYFDTLKSSKAYKGGLTYLLWPGMRNNVSLLELSNKIAFMPTKPFYFDEMEWNYNQAIMYLKWEKNKSEYRKF